MTTTAGDQGGTGVGGGRGGEARDLRLPYAGVRVLEVAQDMAGPLAAMILADYGADVVKLEPPGGDRARERPGFAMWNRGKRAALADLTTPDGVARFSALLADADVLIADEAELEPLPAARRAEIERRVEQGLVWCRLSPAGDYQVEGLAPGAPVVESTLSAALGRMLGLDELSGRASGTPADRPVYTHAPIGAYGAAQLAVQAITAEVLRRLSHGRGAVVRTSLLQGMSAGVMRFPFRRVEGSDVVQGRDHEAGLAVKGIALAFLTAECADGRYIQMCARQTQHFANWLHALGLDHLREDPRFSDLPMGMKSEADIAELEQMLRAGMKSRTQAEWMDVFLHHIDVGCDPFLTCEEFLAHPQLVANERLVTVGDVERGPVTELGPLALMSRTPLDVPAGAPPLPAADAAVGWAPRTDPFPRPADVAPGERRLPLEGVTIVELAYFLATPLGPALMAELGARVIKIEPVEGDSYRRAGVEFIHMVHGKESIILDLKEESDRALLDPLLAAADVLVTNFRPGVPERLGFGYQQVHDRHPRLVYLYGASYGSRGEQAHRPAFHSTPNALCGGGLIQAGEGNAPVDDSYPDPVSGLGAGTAIALGLLSQARNDAGQYLETSMLVSTGYALSDDVLAYAGKPPTTTIDAAQRGPGPLDRLFRTADGWVMVAAGTARDRAAVRRVFGIPDATPDREAGREIDAAIGGLSAHDVLARLGAAGVPAARADGLGFEQRLHDIGFLTPAEHPSVGPYWRLDPRVRVDGVAPDRRPATGAGEFTDRILAELRDRA